MGRNYRRKRTRLTDRELYRQDGRVFIVTICTADRRAVFLDVDFGLECVRILERLRAERGNPVFAYCLMPDHVHLVVGVHEGSPLPRFVQSWKSICVAAWKARGGRRSFWQRGYHERAMRWREDLKAACLYVLANPVRKGLVREWREYPLCGSLEWEL